MSAPRWAAVVVNYEAGSLLREAVYWGISAPRRMLLHMRVAETLERRAAG